MNMPVEHIKKHNIYRNILYIIHIIYITYNTHLIHMININFMSKRRMNPIILSLFSF